MAKISIVTPNRITGKIRSLRIIYETIKTPLEWREPSRPQLPPAL
jgi:hypothetical protein